MPARPYQPQFLVWRDGRPRWVPSAKWRALGHKGRDLKDARGRWLDREAAAEAAEALNARLEDGARAEKLRMPVARTCQALVDDYYESVKFQLKAPRTRQDYRNKLALWLAIFGDIPVAAVDKPALLSYYEQCFRTRGHAMANAILRCVSLVMSHGERRGWIAPDAHPARKLAIEATPPRLVVITREEFAALVAAADRLAMPAIGTAIAIGYYSGQRQGDILAMTHATFRKDEIDLKQSKRGAIINCPMVPELAARIETERRSLIADGLLPRGRMLINRRLRQPYGADAFRRDFRAVRELAAEREPGVAQKHFADLRDTAVTNLALAGCTVHEIASITGHQLATVHAIMRHYLAIDSRMARAAIGKLEAWMADPANSA